MGQDGGRRGLLPQVLIPVVVALLVGGTAPWWWKEFFQRGGETAPSATEDRGGGPVPNAGGQLQVRCAAEPASIPAGGEAEVRVLAFTGGSEPVPGASVRIEAGGGWFSSSGTAAELGQTGAGGVFVARWRSPSPAAGSYGMSVAVDKAGFVGGRGELAVAIE